MAMRFRLCRDRKQGWRGTAGGELQFIVLAKSPLWFNDDAVVVGQASS